MTVQAEDRPANRRGTENQPDDRRETEIYLVSIGQTEVSAWVEAPDKPGDREPEENDQSEEDSPEETSDQMQSGGEEIKTADQNAVTVFIVLLLLSGMVIIVEGIRIVKYGK